MSSDDVDLLRATIQQFLDVANYVVDAARDEDWVETRRTALHEQTYSEVRGRTDLQRIANGMVSEAVDNGCSHVAFENLQNIRNRLPNERKFHEWAFRRLYQYVEYKAEPYGISVAQVEPQYTSQRCSSCGYEDEDNRRGQRFCCRSCDYENHADYNAAKNIGLRLLRAQNGDEGGAPVGVRLNSGMLNANGVVPLPESVRAGVHAECHDSVP